MCLNWVLVPQRLPHPGSAGERPDSGGGVRVESGGDVRAGYGAPPG